MSIRHCETSETFNEGLLYQLDLVPIRHCETSETFKTCRS